ncbi:MAG TPA: hypothetical protein VFW00_10620 [Rhodocyclaceae bacterium]|nr:hypothetical protein [Rhodocyclaceae bacterium]
MRASAQLPHRCVQCNTDVTPPIKARKVYWHHPGWYALILINVLIYLVVAMVVRNKAEIRPALCAMHRRKRTWRLTLSLVLMFSCILGICVALENDNSIAIGLMVIGLLVTLVASIRFSNFIVPKRIDAKYIRLKGCGPAFLQSLPAFDVTHMS